MSAVAAPPVSVPHRSAAHTSPQSHLNPNQLLLNTLLIPQQPSLRLRKDQRLKVLYFCDGFEFSMKLPFLVELVGVCAPLCCPAFSFFSPP